MLQLNTKRHFFHPNCNKNSNYTCGWFRCKQDLRILNWFLFLLCMIFVLSTPLGVTGFDKMWYLQRILKWFSRFCKSIWFLLFQYPRKINDSKKGRLVSKWSSVLSKSTWTESHLLKGCEGFRQSTEIPIWTAHKTMIFRKRPFPCKLF